MAWISLKNLNKHKRARRPFMNMVYGVLIFRLLLCKGWDAHKKMVGWGGERKDTFLIQSTVYAVLPHTPLPPPPKRNMYHELAHWRGLRIGMIDWIFLETCFRSIVLVPFVLKLSSFVSLFCWSQRSCLGNIRVELILSVSGPQSLPFMHGMKD